MLLHLDGSSHAWLGDSRRYDLLVCSMTPPARFITRNWSSKSPPARCWRHCAKWSAYSPQARGRSERNFGTWQGRLPQELRLRGITTIEEANRFLREEYLAEFNRRFVVAAAQPGSAFLPLHGQDLERIFALQRERVVNRDIPWRSPIACCRSKRRFGEILWLVVR